MTLRAETSAIFNRSIWTPFRSSPPRVKYPIQRHYKAFWGVFSYSEGRAEPIFYKIRVPQTL